MQEPEISVLVVEDDEDDALLVQDYLSELRTLARHRIDHVSSVPEALSRLEKTEYGVLLVDYRLGSDDGLSLLRQARLRGVTSPAILLTGRGDEELAVEAIRAGATDYIPKSRLRPETLSAAIRHATDLHRARAERELAERRLAAHYAVTRALADSATLEAAAPKIIEAVCESLGWDAGTLWSEDSITRTLGCVALWHRPAIDAGEFERETRALCFAPGGSLPGGVGSGGRPQWIEDMTLETGFKRGRGAARAGLRAAFAFPILLGDRVIAVMEFFSQEARRPDEDRIQTMMSLSGQLGQFIERMRGEEQLVQKARLEALVSDVDAALVQGFDLRQNLQACAEAMVKHLDAALARIWTLSGDGSMLELQASAGMYTHLDGPHGRVPVGKLKIGLIAQERAWSHSRATP